MPILIKRRPVKTVTFDLLATLVKAGAEGLEPCTKPIRTSFSYVFYYKRYVKQLEDGIKWLCDTRSALRRQVEIAKSQKKNTTISPDVESWLAEADAIEAASRRFISEASSRKHLYWPMARYSLSHKCVEMQQQLLERGKDGELFRNVADPAPPPRVGSTFVRIMNPKFSRQRVGGDNSAEHSDDDMESTTAAIEMAQMGFV